VRDPTTPRIPQWAIPAGLAALIVILGAVALIRGSASADPTTPEGALRLYLEGIAEADWEKAYRFLDPDDFPGCEASDIANAGFVDPFTALHRSTRLNDGSAVIRMDLRIGEGLFAWTNQVDFQMVERDGFWYVRGDPWPHFRWNC
jgi:hypothetical protein